MVGKLSSFPPPASPEVDPKGLEIWLKGLKIPGGDYRCPPVPRVPVWRDGGSQTWRPVVSFPRPLPISARDRLPMVAGGWPAEAFAQMGSVSWCG